MRTMPGIALAVAADGCDGFDMCGDADRPLCGIVITVRPSVDFSSTLDTCNHFARECTVS